MHGDADIDLPTAFTTSFAGALKAGRHNVSVQIVPAATHDTLYSPDVCGARLLAWLRSLPNPRRTP